jgi:hypothetical protein
MKPFLHPCESCSRHFRADEAACPFCGAAAPAIAARDAVTSAARPVTRAALLFMGATAVAGCSSNPSTTAGVDASTDTGPGPAPAYGPGPIFDSGQDTGGPVALYGPGPTPDAGTDAAEDSGGGVVLYGPGPVDSGTG